MVHVLHYTMSPYILYQVDSAVRNRLLSIKKSVFDRKFLHNAGVGIA